jgi:hypothetical protein
MRDHQTGRPLLYLSTDAHASDNCFGAGEFLA